MPCKPSCATPRPAPPPPRQIPQARVIPLDQVQQRRAREAMCIVCPFRRSCAFGGPAGDDARRDPEQTCWAGRWPHPDGTIILDGIASVGVPWGVRLRVGVPAALKVLRHHLRPNGLYAGCGCFVGPLRIWHWLLDAAPPERELAAATSANPIMSTPSARANNLQSSAIVAPRTRPDPTSAIARGCM